jgi:hypothetical protein
VVLHVALPVWLTVGEPVEEEPVWATVMIWHELEVHCVELGKVVPLYIPEVAAVRVKAVETLLLPST